MAAVQTLKMLADQVLNYLDQAGDAGTTKNVVYDTIRRAHAARCTEQKWNFMLWSEPKTLTLVVGQRQYSLHQEFFRPLYFYSTTNKQFLVQVTEQTLLQGLRGYAVPYDFDIAAGAGTDWTNTSGSAYRFKFSGISPVANQPTSASGLTITGETGKTVTVYGETEDGVTSETITVGTPGSVEFTKILDIAKGDGWTQTMTMTSNSGAVTNLKLFASEAGRQYRQIELLTSPNQAESIQYQFYRQPSALPSDNSVPNIPAPFSNVLVYDALILLSEYNDGISPALLQHASKEQLRLVSGLMDYDQGTDAINADAQYINYIE